MSDPRNQAGTDAGEKRGLCGRAAIPNWLFTEMWLKIAGPWMPWQTKARLKAACAMPDKKSRTDRAEAMFKRAEEGKGAMADHYAADQSVRDKTARLKALRLAKEAADKLEPEPVPPPPASKRR
jgi:hypothetical protein